MRGADIRSVTFVVRPSGYDPTEVTLLLASAADVADRGGDPATIVRAARFYFSRPGFDIDAVDWFLDRIAYDSVPPSELSGAGVGWAGLAVSNTIARGSLDADVHGAKATGVASKVLAAAAAQEEVAFESLPGISLARRPRLRSRELVSDDQVVAECFRLNRRVEVAGRSYGVRRLRMSSGGPAEEMYTETARDRLGHHSRLPVPQHRGGLGLLLPRNREVRDVFDRESGQTVAYLGGLAFGFRSYATVTFTDGRRYRLLTRGARKSNSTMSVVDGRGLPVVAFRYSNAVIAADVVVKVAPSLVVEDSTFLLIALAANSVGRYFDQSGGGG